MLFDPYLRAPQTSCQEMAELAKAAEAKAEVSEALQVLLDLPPTVGKRRTKYSGLTSKKKRNVTIKNLELIMKTRGLSAEIRIYHKELRTNG